ncbi:hypothetical protein PSV09DRAFT_1201516, partial [Bipolaris maydis]
GCCAKEEYYIWLLTGQDCDREIMGYVIACAKARHFRPGHMTGVPGHIDAWMTEWRDLDTTYTCSRRWKLTVWYDGEGGRVWYQRDRAVSVLNGRRFAGLSVVGQGRAAEYSQAGFRGGLLGGGDLDKLRADSRVAQLTQLRMCAIADCCSNEASSGLSHRWTSGITALGQGREGVCGRRHDRVAGDGRVQAGGRMELAAYRSDVGRDWPPLDAYLWHEMQLTQHNMEPPTRQALPPPGMGGQCLPWLRVIILSRRQRATV